MSAEVLAERLAKLERENRALHRRLDEARRRRAWQDRIEQLERHNASLRQQVRRLQRLAALGTMTCMVAHEFNNILTPIINYAQLAQKDPSKVEKALARAIDGGGRASEICRSILGLARDDTARPVPVNIAELLSQTLQAMGRDPSRDGISVTLNAPAELELVTRKVELQQVLLNLLLNARTAVLQRGEPRRIDITVSQDREQVYIRVIDNGVGIEPGHLGRIFEPFFTTAAGRDDRSGGNGLGLAGCREIVRSLGGEISATSTPGQGATFTVVLPTRPS
ncbi:MAG: HAMP domain-containing histidine kinase [Planctomycetes bacterium]|nr:HAMP domain-containing histidine kinase [Planctomycetota bacterium]